MTIEIQTQVLVSILIRRDKRFKCSGVVFERYLKFLDD